MKIILKSLLLVSLFFSGCATTAVQHTIYQQQIGKKQDKLTNDAKDFIVKANQMLNSKGKVDIKRVKNLLEQSQSLLGVTVDDGKELKNLDGEDLDKAVDKVVAEAEKEKESIADLRKKENETINKMISENIKFEIIQKHERSKTIKFYTICGVILSILGALFYFFPSKFLNIGTSIVGFLFKK
jgi:DNA-binding ferritin-like protein (Dps family)